MTWRRRWPLAALTVMAWAQIVILIVALGTTNGVQIALVPAISLLSYLPGRRETQLKHIVMVCGWSLLGGLALTLVMRRQVPVTESILSWLVMLLLALLLIALRAAGLVTA